MNIIGNLKKPDNSLLKEQHFSPKAVEGSKSFLFVLSLDLELGHKSSHFSELFQNENVCDFRNYSHDFWSHSGNI